ncbi:MAG: SsrA-binding protein [Cyclobacteriaceae bacterium]|nr:SsrA-binding protein [Cyclobacteriaceae bacterium]
MKLTFFRLLAKINKAILPSYKHKDLTKLSKKEKAIIGWRIWVTKNSLGN